MKLANMFNLSHILLPKSFVVTLQGKTYTILRSEPGFKELHAAAKRNDIPKIENLLKKYGYLKSVIEEVKKQIGKKHKQHLNMTVMENGSLVINGVTFNNNLTKKIVDLVDRGHQIDSYYALLQKIANNSAEIIRSGLLDFIIANDLPITTDGCFLAYKVTDSDGYDIHSRRILYKVGKTISEPREEVSADRGVCSGKGLYFASKGYYEQVSSYTEESNKRFLVKVDPVDVVCIPLTYEKSKGRCCQYTVVKEIGWDEANIPSHEGIVNADNLVAVKTIKKKPTKQKTYQKAVIVKTGTQNLTKKRDANGRFIKKKSPLRDNNGKFIKRVG